MRVEDIVKLCFPFTHITIKARMSIFGCLHDVKILSFTVSHGKAEIEPCNIVLLYEEVLQLKATEEGLSIIIRGCE